MLVFPVVVNNRLSHPYSCLREGYISFWSSDMVLICTETESREAIECNRYFPAAVRNKLRKPWHWLTSPHQVDDQAEEQNKKQEEQKSKKMGKVKKGRDKKGADPSDPSTDRYRGYELLLDDDPEVEMEVELPKGRMEGRWTLNFDLFVSTLAGLPCPCSLSLSLFVSLSLSVLFRF